MATALGIEPWDGVATASRQPDALDQLCQLRDVRLAQPGLSRAGRGGIGEKFRRRRRTIREVHASKLRTDCDACSMGPSTVPARCDAPDFYHLVFARDLDGGPRTHGLSTSPSRPSMRTRSAGFRNASNNLSNERRRTDPDDAGRRRADESADLHEHGS
jgi:hypothetical protein